MLAVWYFAGMFRQTWMMVLAVLMTAAAIYQRLRLRLSLLKSRSIAFKKLEKEVAIKAENRSRLPVNRYKVKLLIRYTTDKTGVKRRLNGCAGGRKENDDNISEFYINAPYCGVISIELKKISVFDPLTLFSSGARIKGSGEILVFPVEKRMNLIMPAVGSYDDIPLTDTRAPKQGDDHSEVHLIRMRLQFMGESIHIVYSLAGTNSAFRYVVHASHASSDVSLMLLAPLVPERRYPSDFFLFLATPELPAFSTFPHRNHRPLRKASRLSHSGLQGSRWNRVSCS